MHKTKLKKADASIVIPAYNNKKELKKNLPEIIKAKNNKSNRLIEVIVVDDASTDGSDKYIKNNFPEVKLVRHRKNRGFSASVNTGARTAKGSLLVMMNSDVIPEKDFIEPVFKHFQNKKVFGVSLHEEGFSWATASFEDGFLQHRQGKKVTSVHETFWVNGGSSVIRRDYWMKLGGMDEKLMTPFYMEDIDLSYRAAKRGLVNLWEPNARVVHKHETTIGRLPKSKVDRIKEKNYLLFHWKNITSPNLFRQHRKGVLNRMYKSPGYVKIVFLALTKLRQIIKARQMEKKESKVSDEAIFAKF